MKIINRGKNKKGGFTLIEVLVVLGIIIAIILLSRFIFSTPRIKARNLKRVSDVNTVQTALGLYYKDQGFYPTTLTAGLPLKSPDNQKTYLYEVPSNPKPRTDNNCPDSEYKYWVSNNNQAYSFSACIEDSKTGKNKLIFGTKEAVFQCGDRITDRDGFTYGTVSIGSQCWMAESLRTRTNPDGTCINQSMSSTVSGHRYTVGSAPDCKIYDNGVVTSLGGYTVNQAITSGRDCISPTQNLQGTETDCTAGFALYSWPAALGHTTSNPLVTVPGYQSLSRQGICPDGWHVPTWDEYTTLERTVCISATCTTDFPAELITTGDRGTSEGARLRAGGSSGFAALGIGQRRPHPTDVNLPAVFYHETSNYFWTTAYNGDYNQSGRRVVYGAGNDLVNRKYTYIYNGYSVRCIKN